MSRMRKSLSRAEQSRAEQSRAEQLADSAFWVSALIEYDIYG